MTVIAAVRQTAASVTHGVSTPAVPLRTVWPPLELEDHPIDEFPSIRVLVVGAGVSGITAGILLPAKVPNIDLVIYERQNDLVSVMP